MSIPQLAPVCTTKVWIASHCASPGLGDVANALDSYQGLTWLPFLASCLLQALRLLLSWAQLPYCLFPADIFRLQAASVPGQTSPCLPALQSLMGRSLLCNHLQSMIRIVNEGIFTCRSLLITGESCPSRCNLLKETRPVLS